MRLLLNECKPSFQSRLRLREFSKKGYMSGGAGYVLSRAALRQFVKGTARNLSSPSDAKTDTTTSLCPNNENRLSEDWNLGLCMESLGVRFGESRDPLGRHRFLPLNLPFFLVEQQNYPNLWLWNYTFHPIGKVGIYFSTLFKIKHLSGLFLVFSWLPFFLKPTRKINF